MAEKLYKVGESIEIVYQAPNAESGLIDVTAEVYLPSNSKDSNFPDITLEEMDNTGEYREDFTPDEQGEWKVIIHKASGDGKVVKRYSVGAHNVHSVGEVTAAVSGKTSNIQTVVNAIDTQLDTVESKIDEVNTKVGALDTPPMVS